MQYPWLRPDFWGWVERETGAELTFIIHAELPNYKLVVSSMSTQGIVSVLRLQWPNLRGRHKVWTYVISLSRPQPAMPRMALL